MDRPATTFDAFYQQSWPQLLRFLTTLVGNRAAAEDLAQEAFLAASQQWTRISAFDSPTAWTWRVAINLSRKAARRRRVERRYLAGQLDLPTSTAVEATPNLELHLALAALPERQRLAVVLRLVDRPYDEIAEILGVSRDYARQLHHRGLDRLRRRVRVIDG